MGDWNENGRRHKRAQQDPGFDGEGQRGRKQRPRHPVKEYRSRSKKVLIDRLEAARKWLLWYEERAAEHGKDSWWCGDKSWAKKRYLTALQACHDAGIDIKA
jgi:hypothetical protein